MTAATATGMEAGVMEASEQQATVVSRVVNRYQTTIPREVRELYDLREGDILEWHYDRHSQVLSVTPKRAQLLAPADLATHFDAMLEEGEQLVR